MRHVLSFLFGFLLTLFAFGLPASLFLLSLAVAAAGSVAVVPARQLPRLLPLAAFAALTYCHLFRQFIAQEVRMGGEGRGRGKGRGD